MNTPASLASTALTSPDDLPGRAWKRIELLPGLELHLVDGASDVLRELVRDVARRFGGML